MTAQSGDPVLLSSDQLKTRTEDRWDIRWTHLHLMVSLNKNVTTCQHGRCNLLSDGSLRFPMVQPEDAGNYNLEVFHRNGTILMRTHFLLRVEGEWKRQNTPTDDTPTDDTPTDDTHLLMIHLPMIHLPMIHLPMIHTYR